MATRHFESLTALANHFDNVASALPGAERAWLVQIGTHVEQFAKQKLGTYQAGWPPLAAATMADKAKRGFATPSPLLRTGAMQGSIGHSVGVDIVRVGAKDHKAIFHELGTSKMPSRPFIGPAMKESMPENIKIIGAGIAHTFRSA